MKKLPPLSAALLCACFLPSCAISRKAGTGLQHGALVAAESGLRPAAAVADSSLPGIVKGVLCPITMIPAAGGLIVSFPLWFVGTLMGGTALD